MPELISLAVLAAVSFVQNMAFTAVSRSRNSGDPRYHFWCALASNGIWFVCAALIMTHVWSAIETGRWWFVVAAGAVYTVSTSLGSVHMMRIMLKRERGRRMVGAR